MIETAAPVSNSTDVYPIDEQVHLNCVGGFLSHGKQGQLFWFTALYHNTQQPYAHAHNWPLHVGKERHVQKCMMLQMHVSTRALQILYNFEHNKQTIAFDKIIMLA